MSILSHYHLFCDFPHKAFYWKTFPLIKNYSDISFNLFSNISHLQRTRL